MAAEHVSEMLYTQSNFCLVPLRALTDAKWIITGMTNFAFPEPYSRKLEIVITGYVKVTDFPIKP